MKKMIKTVLSGVAAELAFAFTLMILGVIIALICRIARL